MKQKHRNQYTYLFVCVGTYRMHSICQQTYSHYCSFYIGYIEIKEAKLQSNTRHPISAGHVSRHETAPQKE